MLRGETMGTWNFRAAPIVAAIIMALAGCSSVPASNASFASTGPSPDEPDITVAALPSVDLAGLYVAQDEGLFAKQGLHVMITKIASSKAVISAQLKGEVDISAGSYVGYIAARTMVGSVSASSWPASIARTNAATVFGCCWAHAWVATYPSIGKSSVAPWSRSASS